MPSEKTAEFLQAVGEQIRYRRVRGFVLRELADHIADQAQAYRAEGLGETEAEEQAVCSMGDPVLVGQQLDCAHQPRPAWSMLAMTAVMCAAGIGLRLAVAAGSGSPVSFWAQYFEGLLQGLAVLALFYFLDFSLLSRHPRLCYAAALLPSLYGLMLPPYYEGIRLLVLPPVLFFIPLYAVTIFLLRGRRIFGLLCCMALFPLPAFLILSAPLASYLLMFFLTVLILLTVAICQNWFGGCRPVQLLILWGCSALAAWLFFVERRFIVFDWFNAIYHPELDPWGAGYASLTIRNLLDGAQWLGHTHAGYDFAQWLLEEILPDWSNKYSLTYVIARFGWLPASLVLVVLAAFLFFLFHTAARTKNKLGFLVSLSIALLFSMEITVYVLNNVGLMLPIGPPYAPFLTTWAPALISHCGLLGLLLSCHRGQDLARAYVPLPQTWQGKRLSITLADSRLTVSFDFSRRAASMPEDPTSARP